MNRRQWLVSMTVALAVLAAGCGGQAPPPPSNPVPAPAALPDQAETTAAALPFEVITGSMLPPELSSWKELKHPPKAADSARVGDHLYVLVTGDADATAGAAIIPERVELIGKQPPVVMVTAVIAPGQAAETGSFPRAYLRIPYGASLPVPGVLTNIRWDTASGEKPQPSPADPSTPVSSPARPADQQAPAGAANSGDPEPVAPAPAHPDQAEEAAAASATPGGAEQEAAAPAAPSESGQEAATPAVPGSGAVAFTRLTASDLPADLAAWRSSTVQVPGGEARYLDGALYLMVSAGQRNTGGYSVEIRSITVKDGTLLVAARLHTPKPGQMVTQVITYPKAYARVDLSGSGEPPVIVSWE